jgi:N-acetylglucosaminyl-diphospho-decaprenol L-rhamnosyltransferase
VKGLPTLSVVTVAYQSARVIRNSLASLPPVCEIICVDNASTDELDDAVAGLGVKVVRNKANIGYGRACNQGARVATGSFILFMNPDVVFLEGALQALMEATDRYPEAGVFFPLTVTANHGIWFHEQPAIVRLRQHRVRRPSPEIAGDCCNQFVDGGAFVIRASLFKEIGGFDERIFLYFEDDDLSLRLLDRGEPMILVHDARAVHDLNTSTAFTVRGLAARNYHKKRSEIYVTKKHGYEYDYRRDLMNHIGKAFFYALTLRWNRMVGAYGRTLGILSSRREAQAALPGNAGKSSR